MKPLYLTRVYVVIKQCWPSEKQLGFCSVVMLCEPNISILAIFYNVVSISCSLELGLWLFAFERPLLIHFMFNKSKVTYKIRVKVGLNIK